MKPSKSSLFILLTLLALTLSALGVTPVKASTTVVTNNADSGPGSLRNAIANAYSGDTITFDQDYTILLSSELQIINKTLTITGVGHHITISGNDAVRVFYVGDNYHAIGNLTLDHLNIVNGKSTVDRCADSPFSCAGGLLLDRLTTATVSNSTFSNNDGGLIGGAIYGNDRSNLTVFNSTFINNHASEQGGGIYTFLGNMTLTNNTFTGNSANNGYGGGVLNNLGSVTFRNNIFANNSAANGPNCYKGESNGNKVSTFNDDGGNLVWGSIDDCPGVRADPRLGSLGDYGGDVPTLPLLPGSAALSAATVNCPPTDARGVARSSTCDSGAFESQGFILTKSSGDSQSALINTAFANPLLLTVSANNAADPVDNGIVSFTAPASGAGAALTGSPATISGSTVSVSATSNGTAGSYNITASSGGAANVDFALTNLLPPSAITGTASTITATGAILSGTVNANGGSTTVDFEYGLSDSYGSTATADQSPVSGSTDTAVTAALTGLTPNTTYHFRVKAVTAGVTTLGIDKTFTTGLLAPAATTSTATNATTSRIRLNGIVNARGGSATVTFQFGLTTAYSSSVKATQGTVSGAVNTAVSAVLTGLKPNTTYHFRVKAVTTGGSSYGADMTFKTAAMTQRILNGGFNNYTGASIVPNNWVKNVNLVAPDGKNLIVKQEGIASVRVIGNGKLKTLTQTLSLSGALGDPFLFSFWNRGTSVPLTGVCTARVLFFNGTTRVGVKTINCNTGTYAWKQNTISFTAPATYTRIQILFTDDKASGTIWFDAVSLLK